MSSIRPTVHRLRALFVAGVLLQALAAAPLLHAQETGAGRVKIVSGSAFIVRQQKSIPASVGAVVLESDTLRTGDDGRLGVTLRDDTRVSLGPQTEIRIDQIAYAPVEGRLALVLAIARGVMAYVSGQIARLAPDAVRVETPDAVIGVRGTRIAVRVSER